MIPSWPDNLRLVIEHLQAKLPKNTQPFLGYALDWLEPWARRLGLTRVQLEDNLVVLDSSEALRWQRQKHIHEGYLNLLAVECFEQLWRRHLLPEDDLQIHSIQTQFFKPAVGALSAQYELTDLERERILGLARRSQPTRSEATVQIFSVKKQLVVQAEIIFELKLPLRLS